MNMHKSTDRCIDILDVISKSVEGLSLKEICELTNIPKSTVHDIISTLRKRRMLDIDKTKEVHKYKIGVKSFMIGNIYLSNYNFIELAKPYLEELGEKLQRTVFLGSKNDNKVLYLYKYQPNDSPITFATVGTTLTLTATSLGKILLAFDGDYQKNIEGITLEKYTENTITDNSLFKEEIENVIHNGYSVEDRELNDYFYCIGVPIFNSDGIIEAALSITGMYDRLNDYDSDTLYLLSQAQRISKRIGYNGDFYLKKINILKNKF